MEVKEIKKYLDEVKELKKCLDVKDLMLFNEAEEVLIKKTFNINTTLLPKIEDFSSRISLERTKFDIDKFKIFMMSSIFKDFYKTNSYFILTHELINSIKVMIDDMKFTKVVELSSGCGWFTYWMRKYGINILDCIDKKGWALKYLPIVKQYDSIQYVKENQDVELFILSWPYMDSTAYRIWDAMNKGQYLLYIGEWKGGCTANDQFFDEISSHIVDDKWDVRLSFIAFHMLHDTINLFKK